MVQRGAPGNRRRPGIEAPPGERVPGLPLRWTAPPKVGPTFKGLVGRKETVVEAGKEKEITVDEAFIRRHILDPRSATVKGFPPVMPQIPMTDEELKTIVNYLVTVK